MLIVDAHLDLAWNALQWRRELRSTVRDIRLAEAGLEGPGRGRGTVALPELGAAPVALAFGTLLARCTGTPVPGLDHPSVEEANAVAREQLAYYRALEREGHVALIESAAALTTHVAAWQAWERARERPRPPLGVVVSMEGADPITAPAELGEWVASGLRVLGLAHYGPGRYAGGTLTESGLTDLGRALLVELRHHGVVLDLTHLTDAGIDEALAVHDGPVLASHANARALVPHQRQLSDRQILAIAERDGVIGVAFDCWMLDPRWREGEGTRSVVIGSVVDHVDHVCQLTGSAAHVGIGSDLDGGFGTEQSPSDLDTVADLARVPELLRERGYRDEDIAAVMHGNWLRLLERCLP